MATHGRAGAYFALPQPLGGNGLVESCRRICPSILDREVRSLPAAQRTERVDDLEPSRIVDTVCS